MIGEEDFQKVRDELSEYSESWNKLNNQCRSLIKKSKQLIYSIHRGDKGKANMHLKDLEGEKKSLLNYAGDGRLRHSGPSRNAFQEYVEAKAYHSVIYGARLPSMRELDCSAQEYVCGLSDLTGELMRKSIDYMLREEHVKAVELKDVVSEIYDAILSCDLPSGESRRKADQVKYNLGKIEQAVFDAKIRDKI